MSNHHPGNEWYRRLIRSNRPLYRACPKHTKLLVSKAIVQAVEQQGGRFLEKSRSTGYWCAVPYKRSVDKTSQGLRERERDEEDEYQAQNSAPRHPEGHVPASWTAAVKSGINGGPNLNDLAVVAVAQANLPNKGIGAGIPPNRPAKRQLPGPQGAPPKKRVHIAGQNGQFNVRPPALLGPQSSMFGMFPHAGLMQHQHNSAPVWSDHAPAAPPTARGNPVVLPTQLNNLQLDKSKVPLKVPPRNKPPPRKKGHETNPSFGRPDAQAPPPRPGQQQQLPPFAGQMPGFRAGPQGIYPPPYGPSVSFGLPPPGFGPGISGFGGPPFPGMQMDPNAPPGSGPPLSRLTSQVSDWLTQFWPVPTRPGAVHQPQNMASAITLPNSTPPPPSRQAAVEQAVAAAARIPRPLPKKQPKKVAKKTSLLALPGGRPPIATWPPNGPDPAPAPTVEIVKAPSPRPIHKPKKRKSRSMLPQLPYETVISPAISPISEPTAAVVEHPQVPPIANLDTDADSPAEMSPFEQQDSTSTGQYSDPEDPVAGNEESVERARAGTNGITTDLEHSVSASLLKLAGAPSQLFSGISAMFELNNGIPEEGPGPLEDAVPSHASSASRPKPSLLDDYDESPMEARLRTVRWS
jgi:hypothetical protein